MGSRDGPVRWGMICGLSTMDLWTSGSGFGGVERSSLELPADVLKVKFPVVICPVLTVYFSHLHVTVCSKLGFVSKYRAIL